MLMNHRLNWRAVAIEFGALLLWGVVELARRLTLDQKAPGSNPGSPGWFCSTYDSLQNPLYTNLYTSTKRTYENLQEILRNRFFIFSKTWCHHIVIK